MPPKSKVSQNEDNSYEPPKIPDTDAGDYSISSSNSTMKKAPAKKSPTKKRKLSKGLQLEQQIDAIVQAQKVPKTSLNSTTTPTKTANEITETIKWNHQMEGGLLILINGCEPIGTSAPGMFSFDFKVLSHTFSFTGSNEKTLSSPSNSNPS